MKAPQFSIIVPCCNVADSVGDCIGSIQDQIGATFEVILVIETSTDGTEEAVRTAIEGDERFRVICEPRSGSPATPRNTGLEAATGEYVVFVDGDDMLSLFALADLAAWIERYPGTDLFPCAIQEGAMTHDNYPLMLPRLPLSGAEATRLVCATRTEPLAMAQMTVCRRAFLEEHHLRFSPGLRHEDEEFTPRALFLARTVVPTHLPIYLYCRRAGSITLGQRERWLDDLAVVFRHLFRFHVEQHPGLDVSRAWAKSWLNRFYSGFFFVGGDTVAPSDRRKTALQALFNDGFGDFNALVQYAAPPKRVAAMLIRLAVKTGWYAPVVAYFNHVYYPMALRRSR